MAPITELPIYVIIHILVYTYMLTLYT